MPSEPMSPPTSAPTAAPGARPPTTGPSALWSGDPRWALLLLRGFLALVFCYAGLSKIADQRFLDADSPMSIHSTVLAVRSASPIGGLLGPVVEHSFVFGLLMALAETAVGIGFALGLFTRVAAVGGTLLALSLWLTVSWQAEPWYTSADLLYAFACTPFLLVGATPFSVDGWLARTRDRGVHPGDFATRRRLLAGAAALGGLALIGVASLFRRDADAATGGADGADRTPSKADRSGASNGPSPTGLSTPAGNSSNGGSTAGSGRPGDVAVAAVPVGGGRALTERDSGELVWVLQLRADTFTAFSATCPHQGCEVQFEDASSGFACPCHGSRFAADGRVTHGPATRNLTSIRVTRDGDQLNLG